MSKILEGRTGTGFTANGDSVMINRYGDVYPTIDNKMHPNPGTEEDGYSEIERTVDWLYQNDQKAIKPMLDEWVITRVANLLAEGYTDKDEIVTEVFYSDIYTPCEKSLNSVTSAIKSLSNSDEMLKKYLKEDEIIYARKIASWLNENFIRVRAGGKLNPEGADAIYFRISSHGYNWRRVIENFLWDVFKDPKSMPRRIWIGSDSETRPPEVVMYDGTPEDLFTKYDSVIFESNRETKNKYSKLLKENRINRDRACAVLDRNYLADCRHQGLPVRIFK